MSTKKEIRFKLNRASVSRKLPIKKTPGVGRAPRRTQKSKPRLTRENAIILPHFFYPRLFSHKNNYLPIKIIKIYFDKSKFSKYIFMPLNRSMLAREMANITFWHSKIAKIGFSCLQYTHLVYYFTVHLVV